MKNVPQVSVSQVDPTNKPAGRCCITGRCHDKVKEEISPQTKKDLPYRAVAIGLFLIGFAVLALASPKAEVNAGTQNSVVPVDVNYAAPELILQNINDEAESLADYRGQVVLVNNWATVKISS